MSDSCVEVLTLLDKGNVNNYLLAVKSLFMFSGSAPAVTVLSDGSLDAGDEESLRRHVIGIRVVNVGEIQGPSPDFAVKIADWCRHYPHLRKLMCLPFVGCKPLLLFLDSDVIFRRPLSSSFLRLPNGLAVTYNRDHDHSLHDPYFHYAAEYMASRNLAPVVDLNCGLMLWNKQELRPPEALGFLSYLIRRHGSMHYTAEQDAWAILAAQTRSRALPSEYLVLSNWAQNSLVNRNRATAIHYVSGERYRRLDYLRDGLQVIKALKKSEALVDCLRQPRSSAPS